MTGGAAFHNSRNPLILLGGAEMRSSGRNGSGAAEPDAYSLEYRADLRRNERGGAAERHAYKRAARSAVCPLRRPLLKIASERRHLTYVKAVADAPSIRILLACSALATVVPYRAVSGSGL